MTLATVASNNAAAGFLNDLNGAVRENPIAASLIGVGVLWMILGGSKTSVIGEAVAGATEKVTGAVSSGAGAAAKAVEGGLSATAGGIGEAAKTVGDALTTVAHDVGALARDTAASGYDALRGQTATGDVARSPAALPSAIGSQMHSALERQPLLLGALGLAIGVGIASTFAPTETENRFMGEVGHTVKDGVQAAISDATDAARQTMDDMKTEADRQGLTPSKIVDQAKDVGDKLKVVAGAARDSLKERLV